MTGRFRISNWNSSSRRSCLGSATSGMATTKRSPHIAAGTNWRGTPGSGYASRSGSITASSTARTGCRWRPRPSRSRSSGNCPATGSCSAPFRTARRRFRAAPTWPRSPSASRTTRKVFSTTWRRAASCNPACWRAACSFYGKATTWLPARRWKISRRCTLRDANGGDSRPHREARRRAVAACRENRRSRFVKTLFEQLIAHGPVVTDGAWGTQLQARGLPIGACPDAWNLSHPEYVAEVAEAYVGAGSQVILTNTFGANRLSLARYDLAGRAEEINRLGAG